mgnify:CR=1 FL=1
MVGAVEFADTCEGVVGRGEVGDFAFVEGEAEMNGGVADGVEMEPGPDVLLLGGGGTEEFAAGGDVEEQVADFDGGTGGGTGRGDIEEFSSGELEAGAFILIVGAGGEGEAGDGGDGGKGLAAKAKGADAFDVVHVLDLAGGVAFDGEEGVVAVHAAAVVGDAEEFLAAVDGFDFDVGGPGVDGVFDEFLEGGGGALDDFAGRDLVDHMVGEDADRRGRGHVEPGDHVPVHTAVAVASEGVGGEEDRGLFCNSSLKLL